MLKVRLLFALTACVAVTLVNAGYIDYETCNWTWGMQGGTVQCASGAVAVGACGSGHYADCNNGAYYEGLKCCQLVDAEKSGWGDDIWVKIGCCITPELDVTANCRWMYGNYGEQLECSSTGEVMTGKCGSGMKDCPNDSCHGIQCCTYN